MTEYVTSHPVNTSQLCTELGGVSIRVKQRIDGTTRIVADIPLATLAAAVNAHVALPVTLDAASAAVQANAATIRATLALQIAPNSPARNAVASNTTFIGNPKPGTAAAQASAGYDQAKALAQQNNVIIPTLLRVIRLALDQLDDTT